MAKKATTHLRLRVEDKLLQQLENAAEKNGNTLTGEITDRLKTSFNRDEIGTRLKSEIGEFLRRVEQRRDRNQVLLAAAEPFLERLEERTGHQWDQDQETLQSAQTIVTQLMEMMFITHDMLQKLPKPPKGAQAELDAFRFALNRVVFFPESVVGGLKLASTKREDQLASTKRESK